MKKTLFIILIFWVIIYMPDALAWNPLTTGGQTVSSSCPPFYADSNVVLSWRAGGIACDSGGNEVTVTEVGTTDVGTYNGETAMKVVDGDTATNYFRIDQTADQYAQTGTNIQTYCIEMYTTSIQGEGLIEMLDVEGDDGIKIQKIYTSMAVGCYWNTEGNDDNTQGNTVVVDTWHTVGCTFDQAGDQHAANPGDTGTWADGWEEDTGEGMVVQTDGVTDIYIGPFTQGDTAVDEYYLIKQFAIVDTVYGIDVSYDCTSLTEW